MSLLILSMYLCFLLFLAFSFLCQENGGGYLRKSIKRLLRPYVVVSIIICLLWSISKDHYEIIIIESLLGESFDNVYSITLGPAWFFLSLFFCKLFYRFIAVNINDLWKRTVVVLIISTVVCILRNNQYIDNGLYQITIGIVSLFYYHAGVLFSKYSDVIMAYEYHKIRLIVVLISLVVSLFCVLYYVKNNTAMLFVASGFPCFPLDYLNAVLLSFSLFVIVKYISVCHFFCKALDFITWIGKNSIVIYFIHCIEYQFTIEPLGDFVDLYFKSGNNIIYGALRLLNPLVQILICTGGLYLYQILPPKLSQLSLTNRRS